MLLLRAILSLFQSPTTIRADLPPPPRTNRARDLIYSLIIGSAVLAGFFWLLYLDITAPTPAANEAQAANERARHMKDVDSRPVNVSLTFFEDGSAAATTAGNPSSSPIETTAEDAPPARDPLRKIEIPLPPPELLLKPTVEFAPPPSALLNPDFSLPAPVGSPPGSLTAPVPAR